MHRFYAPVFGLVVLLSALCTPPLAWAATLENPAVNATMSGIGIVSGWKCQARNITVRFNGGNPLPAVIGLSREDTRSVCGTAATGFLMQMNWNLLGDGDHEIIAYDDGVEFARLPFTVATPGVEFLQGVSGEGAITLSNGQVAHVRWSTAVQGFVAIRYTDPPPTQTDGRVCTTKTVTVEDPDEDFGRWTITNPCDTWPGYASILHIDITPLSQYGFWADVYDLVIKQGATVWNGGSYDPAQGTVLWVDRDTRRGFEPYLQAGVGDSNTYHTTLVVGTDTGLDLSQPFTLYYPSVGYGDGTHPSRAIPFP